MIQQDSNVASSDNATLVNYKSVESSGEGGVKLSEKLRRPSVVSKPFFKNSTNQSSSDNDSSEDESVKELKSARKAKILISEDYQDEDERSLSSSLSVPSINN